MQKEHLDQLAYMCRMYGAYEVTKALRDIAKETSKEYDEMGNHEAIIHSDATLLDEACTVMASTHQLRKFDVK